jgi:TonB family protein
VIGFVIPLLLGVVLVTVSGPPSLAQTRTPVPPPGASTSRVGTTADTLDGTYLADGQQGVVRLKSLSNGGLQLEAVGRFWSLGFFDGVEYVGLLRKLQPGSGLGWVRFRAIAGVLEAEVFDSLSATSGRRERWTREVVVAPPESPKLGEYVYVEELPEAVEKHAPAYPQGTEAEGTVMIQALVGTDGLVKDTKVVKSIPELDAAAVAAVMRWRFKPALAAGKPVAVWVAVPVKFSRH